MFSPIIREADLERFAKQKDSKLPKFSYVGPILHRGKTTCLIGNSILFYDYLWILLFNLFILIELIFFVSILLIFILLIFIVIFLLIFILILIFIVTFILIFILIDTSHLQHMPFLNSTQFTKGTKVKFLPHSTHLSK